MTVHYNKPEMDNFARSIIPRDKISRLINLSNSKSIRKLTSTVMRKLGIASLK